VSTLPSTDDVVRDIFSRARRARLEMLTEPLWTVPCRAVGYAACPHTRVQRHAPTLLDLDCRRHDTPPTEAAA
jgi:hypothetical protein